MRYKQLEEGIQSGLVSYKKGDNVWLDSDVAPNFWRAPTDNDFGARLHRNLGVWRSAGHNRKVCNVDVKEEKDKVIVTYHYRLTDVSADLTQQFTVDGNGDVWIELDYKTTNEDLKEMPRFGVSMSLCKSLNNYRYYGRGLEENYTDRCHGSLIGVYQTEIDKMLTPYVRPQENGARTDIRRLLLTDNKGNGIEIVAAQPLIATALNYASEDFDPGLTKKFMHRNDLYPRSVVVLSLDLFQRGLGGINSWG